MGAFLDKPKTEKHTENGGGNGIKFGLSSMQGWRVEMEDAHCAVIGLPGLEDWSFFAVFDGHAGAKVSAYCSDQLILSINSTEEFKTGKVKDNPETKAEDGEGSAVENVKKALKTGFLALDERIRELPEIVSGEDKSGSTAVSVMMSPEQIYFANCGDSRGILCSDGKVAFATQDHKPVNPEEKARIQNAGGSVMIQRVNGSLAVSRALGDFEYKNVAGKGPCEQLVSPEPEISEINRDASKDEFIVLACDGIWDVMSNDELCAFVRNRLALTDDLKSICNQVLDTCLYKGSRDNMSIIIITLPAAPSVSEEALQRERELDQRLEEKVKEILDQADPLSKTALLPYVIHLLGIADIDGLPPGGGLSAKKNTVEEIVNRLNPPTPTPTD